MDEHRDELLDKRLETHAWLAEQFEGYRTHLSAVAYRMLGSPSEAEDAVQESWLRLSRTDTSDVANLGGWLTTVVARVCLDMLRSRTSRREEPLEADEPGPIVGAEDEGDPEHEALLADSVALALQVVLDALNPAERLAFVLHDLFDVPFDQIAPIVGRSSEAARQLASRARRRVRGATAEAAATQEADLARQRAVVDAFLAASRGGNFEGLLALLDPEVVFRCDPVAALAGAPEEVRGAAAVAKQFSGRARGAQPTLVNGAVGLSVARQGQLSLVLRLTIRGGKIAAIDAIADAAQLGQLDLQDLPG